MENCNANIEYIIIVPFAHLKLYSEKFPQAKVREIESNEHASANGLPQLAQSGDNIS